MRKGGRSVVRLNQHFLRNESVMEQIVGLADIQPEEIILEIGPGEGAITRKMAPLAEKVVAIEADPKLRDALTDLQRQYPNIDILYGDALNMKWPRFDRMVSNLPFNMTEPLIHRLSDERFSAAVLLVGETFADNCCNDIGYNTTTLGLLTKAYFRTEHLLHVPGDSFDPPPSTDTDLIALYPIGKRDLIRKPPLYLVHCLWKQRTRSVRDALSAALYQYVSDAGDDVNGTKRVVEGAEREISYMGQRVDKLTNDQFRNLYQHLEGIATRKLFSGHKPRGGSKNWRITYGNYL